MTQYQPDDQFGLSSLIDTNKFPPGYTTFPEHGQPGYGGHLTQGPVQPLPMPVQPGPPRSSMPTMPGDRIRQPWPPRLGLWPPRGGPKQPAPWEEFGETLGGYGETLGGYGETLGGYGEQMGGFEESLGGYGEQLGGFEEQLGGYGEQMGGFESTLGGLGEKMGGFGKQFSNISDRLGKIEEGIAGLNKQSPMQQPRPPGHTSSYGYNPYSMLGGLGGLFGYPRGFGRY